MARDVEASSSGASQVSVRRDSSVSCLVRFARSMQRRFAFGSAVFWNFVLALSRGEELGTAYCQPTDYGLDEVFISRQVFEDLFVGG